ncbi:MAG: hypothetical protein ACSLE6_00510 [Mycobacterium sp.]
MRRNPKISIIILRDPSTGVETGTETTTSRHTRDGGYIERIRKNPDGQEIGRFTREECYDDRGRQIIREKQISFDQTVYELNSTNWEDSETGIRRANNAGLLNGVDYVSELASWNDTNGNFHIETTLTRTWIDADGTRHSEVEGRNEFRPRSGLTQFNSRSTHTVTTSDGSTRSFGTDRAGLIDVVGDEQISSVKTGQLTD